MSEYAVLDVNIVGQSTQPFHYNEGHFFLQYMNGTNTWGRNLQDPTIFPPELRQGALTMGQEVHGTIPIDVSMHAQFLVFMTDDSYTNRLAQWRTTSA